MDKNHFKLPAQVAFLKELETLYTKVSSEGIGPSVTCIDGIWIHESSEMTEEQWQYLTNKLDSIGDKPDGKNDSRT